MTHQTKSIEELQISDSGQVELPIVPQLLDDPLSSYALKMVRKRGTEFPLDGVLLDMEEMAAIEQIPIIGPLEGAVIQILMQLRQPPPRKVLDIGTAIGYSALWLARALPKGSHIVSIEIDPQRAQTARDFIEKARYHHQIEVIIGDVLDLLPTMGKFDIIFQDVIKHVYFGADSRLSLQLLECCLEHLEDGGLLLGDNAFCMGEVLHNDTEDLPAQIRGIQAYNDKVATHPELDSVIIPVRDGLWVSHRRKGEQHE